MSTMASFHLLGCLWLTVFLLSICLPMNFAEVKKTWLPEVTIPQGNLLGIMAKTRHGRDVFSFMGIPYAQPPIGNLRFASPVAADSWSGTLNASVDTEKCPEILVGVFAGHEDCLYLNVFTPQLPRKTNSSPLPVMVYIHGGGFQGEYPGRTGPEYLLDGNVVLVTIRYRVSSLGFLSTGDEVAPGNWGLKDQVLALKWVQNNIRYFGGDSDQVTIFGESAGAGAVHLLSLSDMAGGLFHRYITQSGSALAKWAYRPSAAYSARAFQLGQYVGCTNKTSKSLISCLRTVHFTDIIKSVSKFRVWEFLPDVIWGPTDEPDIEGAFLTDTPANLVAAGKTSKLPWMNGVVGDEGLLYSSMFYTDDKLLQDFRTHIDTILPELLCWTYDPDSGAAWINSTKSYYFNNDLTASKSTILKKLTKLIGDVYFNYPAFSGQLLQHALATSRQYFYLFNYRGTNSFSYTFGGGTTNYGVAHSDDLLYLFPNDSEFAAINKTMSETDYEMVDRMVQLWTSFAINGKPTASVFGDEVTWEPYSKANNYLRIGCDSDVGFEVEYSFYEERMQFWKDLYDTAADPQDDSDDSGSQPSP